MKKKYYWIIVTVLIVLSAFSILFFYMQSKSICLGCGAPYLYIMQHPYFCNTSCLLVSESNDPNLYDIYSGVNGSATPIEWINVSCISEEYYNSNNPKYHYQANVYLPEIDCLCINNKCQTRPIRMLPP